MGRTRRWVGGAIVAGVLTGGCLDTVGRTGSSDPLEPPPAEPPSPTPPRPGRFSLDAPLVAGEWGQLRTETGWPAPDDSVQLGARQITVSDTSVLSVDAFGRVFAWRAGTARVRVVSTGTLTWDDSLAVTVNEPPPEAFTLSVVVEGPPLPPRLAQALAQARTRWQRALRTNHGVRQVDLSVDPWVRTVCGSAHAGTHAVQGLLLVIREKPVPHGYDAFAGPCLLDGDGLPSVSFVWFRPDLMATLERASPGYRWFMDRGLENLVAHEMGHALGLVGMTATPPVDRATSGWRWTGAAANAAYTTLWSETGGVPISPDGVHWAVTGPFRDVMSSAPWYPLAGISAVSLGALRDVGYDVRMAMAESVSSDRWTEVSPSARDGRKAREPAGGRIHGDARGFILP